MVLDHASPALMRWCKLEGRVRLPHFELHMLKFMYFQPAYERIFSWLSKTVSHTADLEFQLDIPGKRNKKAQQFEHMSLLAKESN